MPVHSINSEPIGLDIIDHILTSGSAIAISEESLEATRKCRNFLEAKIQEGKETIYGINTGFGALYDKEIAGEDLETLQEKLIISHACGLGAPIAPELVKIILFLKIQSLSYGYSGIREETLQLLTACYNKDILPVIYEQGSLGASGDLAPLAHLSLPLIGKGEVWYKGKRMPAKEVFHQAGLSPIRLGSKEGLALLNGTQFMSGLGMFILWKFNQLLQWADCIAALSLDAYDGRLEPFFPQIHAVRPHAGQVETAETILYLLSGSAIASQPKKHVQDPYSFRCIPQVHGASKDAYWYCLGVFLNEINSVTDNPTIFPEDELIISGGNFHGQPLAIALDFMSIAIAEIGSISERRIYKLISGNRELPDFLSPEPGLNSGFMIAQYTAASIVSQNKQLCTPASIDTIDSSKGQEDHVSMGANAATKTLKLIENLEKILAIELLCAAQALEFRRPLKTSPVLEKCMQDFREEIPFLKEDNAVMHDLMKKSILFIQEHLPEQYHHD